MQISGRDDTAGIIPASELPTPSATQGGSGSAASASPVVPAGQYISDFSANGLSDLWSQVEIDLPVEQPSISSVPPLNTSFDVPKTPLLPSSLQDHLSKDIKAPKGFAWGVVSINARR